MSVSGPGAVSGSGERWAGYAAGPTSQGAAHDAVRVLSIDLGTSNTVAVLSAHGRPPRVVDVDGASAMPSAVFAAADGRLVVGREALRLARTEPERFEPNPKRRVDDGDLLLGDVVVPVATALSAVLGKVVAEATRQLGGSTPDQVRLTHPAQWGSARCAVLLDAARQAGIDANLHLVPEPVAAAAHFASVTGRPLDPGQALAVYDLGAGTFDVAVVGAGQHGLTVLAEAGLTDLGGRDVDQALSDHLGRQVGERDPAAWQRLVAPRSTEDRRAALVLHEDIRVAKEALSEHPQTEVAMPEPFGSVLVTRAELETLIRPGLQRSVELLGTTTRGAGMDVNRLTGVYLVGGSSRIPLVATLMAEQLRIVPTALDQPETAVALGAHQVNLNGLGPFTQPAEQTQAQPYQQQAQPYQHAAPYPHGLRANPPVKRRIGRTAVVSALSAVVVAAVVAVIVLAPWRSDPASSSPSDSDSSAQDAGPNGKGGFHWSLTRKDAGLYEGMWAANDSVVLGHWKGLTSYDVESGKELWSWDLPEGNYLCNMSQTLTAGGLGAVTYGPKGATGDECHNLQTISTRTGEPNWEEPVSLAADGASGSLGQLGGISLSISDTVVTAPYSGRNSQEDSTDLTWFDTETGERLGSTDVGTQPVRPDLGCRLTGHAQAQRDAVVAIVMCSDSTPKLMGWSKVNDAWGLITTLDGCPEVSNVTDTAFMRQGAEDELLIGCFSGGQLRQLYHSVSGGGLASPIDLDGLAVDTIGTGGGGGNPPENVLLDKRDVYVPRGEGGTSNGVVVWTGGYSWEYTLRDTSEVRLMGVDEGAVTLMVVKPGPAALYTVSGANEMKEAPELDPEVADKLDGAKHSYRVGDYLVCGFGALKDDNPVIGVVRMAD